MFFGAVHIVDEVRLAHKGMLVIDWLLGVSNPWIRLNKVKVKSKVCQDLHQFCTTGKSSLLFKTQPWKIQTGGLHTCGSSGSADAVQGFNVHSCKEALKRKKEWLVPKVRHVTCSQLAGSDRVIALYPSDGSSPFICPWVAQICIKFI